MPVTGVATQAASIQCAFGECQPGSIPASSPPSTNLDRDAGSLKLLIHPPARAVYRCRVSKRCFDLHLDLRQQLWPVGEKRLNGLIGFGLVARPTGNHQIADPITSSFGAWMDVINFEIACRACNEAKADQPIEAFLADRPELLAHIQLQMKTPLADAAAVNSTRWRLYEELKALGLPIEVGTGGRTRWNRTRLALPKTHWIDAATVGASTPDRLRIEHVRPWLIEAKGRQHRQRVTIKDHGFPPWRAKGPSRVRGFRTGDLVKAVCPPHLNARGVHVGRVLIRTRGTFDVQTRHGRVKDIPARCCQSLQQKDGYAYDQGAALPPHA